MVDVERLQRILIVGAGSSGLAAARLAADRDIAVTLTDSRPEAELSASVAALPPTTRAFFGSHPSTCLESVDGLVVSPGVPPTIDLITEARARNLPIISEPEFAWFHRQEAPLVAITGSNGKSTVTALTAAMLHRSGMAVASGGNLGPPACELVRAQGWESWVLEISSFQSELFTELAPSVGVFLNLSQDHLERHPDVETYREAKRRLFAFQSTEQTAVLNLDDTLVSDTPTKARVLHFSLRSNADARLDGSALVLFGEHLIDRDRLALAGLHNVANALAASLAAHALGASREAIASALQEFEGLDHRHRTVMIRDGVRWVDDSKATNVGATVAALAGYARNSVHLILGGLAKGQDFLPLRAEVERAAKCVYLIGKDREEIAAALSAAVPAEDCETLEEATRRAAARAQPGETILLAPACASFDQFSSYADRGSRFAELAKGEAPSCR